MVHSTNEILKLNNFIDGQMCAPRGDLWLEHICPATGKVDSLVPRSSREDVERAVKAAGKAFQSWSKTAAEERAFYLNKIADGIEARLDEFAKAESEDQGKPVHLARAMDVPRAIANFRFFAGEVLHAHDEAFHSGGERAASMPGGVQAPTTLNYVERKPIGVAGLISPWNLPLYLLTWKIAPALAYGNTVVCKPSEFTSRTAWLLASVLIDIGLPNGVVNIVFGLGSEVGQVLVEHPDVPLISFTGGTATGALIAQTAAPLFKKLSLELGGKNANVIFNDADLDEAAKVSIRSSFLNQGEICLCGSRILIHADVFDQFLEKFLRLVREIKVGDPADPNSFMGALVSGIHFKKVLQAIEAAKSGGADVLMGGARVEMAAPFQNGYFVQPTVLAGRIPTETLKEEIFGPVVTVQKFTTDAEAVQMANDVRYGLSASIWTRDLSRAHKVSSQLEVGTVWVNTWMSRDLRVPFGGAKASGVGREGGKHSREFYTEAKTICVRL